MVDFGVFIMMQQRNAQKSSRQILQEAVEQTCIAEQAGFGAAWYAEHHFNNYGLCPSPLMMVAHCAALTTRIRLGTGVVIAPLYNPARLIAEIALADQFSNGRLNLGIGGGYQQFEFERFGVSLDSAKEVALEMLDMIELGLTKSTFSYDGKFLKQPPSAISVRSVQAPLPDVWIASADPSLMRRAIRSDYTMFVSGVLGGSKRLERVREGIDQLCLEENKDPAKAKVGLLRFAYASENQREIDHYVDCSRYQQRVAVSLKRRTESVADDYMVAEKPFEDELPLDKIMSNLPVGPVDEVVAQLVQEIRTVKPRHVAIQTQVGDFDHRTMMRQLELWGERIIPAVQRELGVAPAPRAATLGAVA
jgi:alkanesulfonate monooxygenase SsuD/methylene tetrahydromethanopterin reductase-like flavin-dependent oxidoreductase (luciferase family)